MGRNKKEAEEICRPEGEGKDYLSEGEDGRPCIKWRKRRTTNPTGREKEGEEEELGGEEKVETQEYRDVETEGLIREYQKNTKPTQATMKIL